MTRKQSTNDRLDRLNRGDCPIHGLWMSQIDRWYESNGSEPYTIVGCPRKDCDARAKASSFDGPWELLPDCFYLLDERYQPPAIPRNKKQKSKVTRSDRAAVWAKTDGRCYYCGLQLENKSSFCVDHIVPQIAGGTHDVENLVPACKHCNSAKGTKSVEDFRFTRRMGKFLVSRGISFTRPQVEYLASLGVILDIPEHTFWFEGRL